MSDPSSSHQKASAGLQWQQQQQHRSQELAFPDQYRPGGSQVYPLQHTLPTEGVYHQIGNQSSRFQRPQGASGAEQQQQQHQYVFEPLRVTAANYQAGSEPHLSANDSPNLAMDHSMPQGQQQVTATAFPTSATVQASAYNPFGPLSTHQASFGGSPSYVQHSFGGDPSMFPMADSQGSSSRTRPKFSAAIDVNGGMHNGTISAADGSPLESPQRQWLPSSLSQPELAPTGFAAPAATVGPLGETDGTASMGGPSQQSFRRRTSLAPTAKGQAHQHRQSQQRSPRHNSGGESSKDSANTLASDQARAEEILKHLRSRAPDSKEGVAACDYCRKRKIRCDRTKPTCGRCAAAGRYCTTSDTLRKRGPPSKKEREFLAAQGIQFLPSRVRRRSSAVESADGPSSSQATEARRYSAADLGSLSTGSKSTGRSRDTSNSSSTGHITPASWSPVSSGSPFMDGAFHTALEQDNMVRPSPRLHFEHLASGIPLSNAGPNDVSFSKIPSGSMQDMPSLARTANRRPLPLNLQLIDSRGGGSSMSAHTSGSDSSQEPWTALSNASSFDTWSQAPSSASFPPPSAHSAGFDAPVFLDHHGGIDYNAMPASR